MAKDKKRVITIELNIDSETHKGDAKVTITENGKVKKEWLPSEAASTASVLILIANDILQKHVCALIESEDRVKEGERKQEEVLL